MNRFTCWKKCAAGAPSVNRWSKARLSVIICRIATSPLYTNCLGTMRPNPRIEHSRRSESQAVLLVNQLGEYAARVRQLNFHLAHQHRSAWTHEVDLRAYSDVPWWNRPDSAD